MKKLLLAAVLCAALVLVSAAGCIGSDPIVGTWETKPVLGIYISAEFANDGTGTITLHSDLIESGESVTFAWEKTADNTYSITSSDKTLPGGTPVKFGRSCCTEQGIISPFQFFSFYPVTRNTHVFFCMLVSVKVCSETIDESTYIWHM